MKTVLIFVMAGAIVGAVAASFIVPPILSWYSEPGAIAPGRPPQTICDPAFMIYYTASHLFRWQLVGAGLGALLFLYPGIAIARRSRATGPLAAA